MTHLHIELYADQIVERERGYWIALNDDPNEDLHVAVRNEPAENGYEQEAGPLIWLNSAQIYVRPDQDEVACCVSVGDPRGCFTFTVRRISNGRLVIHMPYENESMPHMETKQLHDGTLEVLGDFSDPIHEMV